MEHCPEQAWADFVRGVSKSETTKNIESHLASGCTECAAAFNVWKQVHAIAATESTYSPPEDRVRVMKLEFATTHPRQERESIVAKLVFDTLGQPLPAGIRSGITTARQLLYEAEGLTVDLRLDSQPHSNTICAVGQVLDKRVPRVSPGGTSVMLWTPQGQPVFKVNSNEFGEFQLEFEAQNDLRLSIEAGFRTIRIPLPNLKVSNVNE